MKETKIAKENVEKFKETEEEMLMLIKKYGGFQQEADITIKGADMLFYGDCCQIDIYVRLHKQTCQRWLEWLENMPVLIQEGLIFSKKIEDLKQVIEVYEKNGI